MKEETVRVKVARMRVTDVTAARELQDWCEQQPGLYCRVTSHADGGYRIQVGGVTADEQEVAFGDTVTWNGSQFTVTEGD